MVKHTQAIRRQQLTNCLGVFDHYVGLAPKGLNLISFFSKIHFATKFYVEKPEAAVDKCYEKCCKIFKKTSVPLLLFNEAAGSTYSLINKEAAAQVFS